MRSRGQVMWPTHKSSPAQPHSRPNAERAGRPSQRTHLKGPLQLSRALRQPPAAGGRSAPWIGSRCLELCHGHVAWRVVGRLVGQEVLADIGTCTGQGSAAAQLAPAARTKCTCPGLVRQWGGGWDHCRRHTATATASGSSSSSSSSSGGSRLEVRARQRDHCRG